MKIWTVHLWLFFFRSGFDAAWMSGKTRWRSASSVGDVHGSYNVLRWG